MAAAAAASSPVSSPSPLPAELICSIVRHAASTCPTTARTLSLVSHSVCRWTIEERWRTLVCTTPEQLIKLWLLFLECADRVASHSSSSVDGSHPTTTVGTAGLPISYPPQGPGGLVRNLFLDTTPSYMPHDGVTYSAYKEALQRIELAPARAAARLSGLLYHMPALEYLALGAAEMQLLQPSLMSVAPFELLIVYDGDDALLSGLFLSGTQKLAHWYEGGHEHDGRRSKSEKRPTLGGIRRRLKRLHVVGLNPRNGLTGIPMPVHVLEPLRAGSIARGSLLHALSHGSLGPSSPGPGSLEAEEVLAPSHHDDDEDEDEGETSQGITHLRYDTHRLSFQTPESTASRLRPFVQEVALDPSSLDSTSTDRDEVASGPSTSTHPYTDPHLFPLSPPSASPSPAHHLLKSWGVSSLSCLSLCWEAPPSSAPSSPPSISGDEWPRERSDVWTSSSISSLRCKFQDALASLYGWNGTSPSRAQYVSRIRQGFAPDDVVALQAVERAVQRQSGAASQKQRQGEVKGEIKLGFHPRKPDEFVRLATNPAALTRQERLEIFLDTARGREASW